MKDCKRRNQHHVFAGSSYRLGRQHDAIRLDQPRYAACSTDGAANWAPSGEQGHVGRLSRSKNKTISDSTLDHDGCTQGNQRMQGWECVQGDLERQGGSHKSVVMVFQLRQPRQVGQNSRG